MSLDDFERYCEKLSNHVRGVEDPAHRALIRSLVGDSQRFGIRNVRAAYADVALFKNHAEIGNIDVILFGDETYVCEVKATDKSNAGSSQLERAYEYVRDNFGVLAIRLCVRKYLNGRIKITKTPAETLDILAQARA